MSSPRLAVRTFALPSYIHTSTLKLKIVSPLTRSLLGHVKPSEDAPSAPGSVIFVHVHLLTTGPWNQRSQSFSASLSVHSSDEPEDRVAELCEPSPTAPGEGAGVADTGSVDGGAGGTCAYPSSPAAGAGRGLAMRAWASSGRSASHSGISTCDVSSSSAITRTPPRLKAMDSARTRS